MADEGADVFLASHPANVAYLTGFEDVFDDGSGAVCAVTADAALVVTDSRYEDAARAAASGTPWEVESVSGSVLGRVCELLVEVGAAAPVLEECVTHAAYLKAVAALPGADVRTAAWVEGLRRVKEPEEVERIAAAARLADEAMARVPALLRAGATERDVALEIEFGMRRAGSQGVAFAPIVAGGENSARPHAVPGTRPLARGDLVVVDIGARVRGYCSDLTRTFCVGAASERQREIHAAVLAANEAGRAAVRAGTAGRDADTVARAVLAAAGLGDAFGHGLGHGVGLEVHELPGAGPSSEPALPAGAVVTVEPGAYLPGMGGVRIEDLVVVGEGACTVLSAAPRDLIEAG